MQTGTPKQAHVLKNYKIQDVPDEEVDIELTSPTRMVGTHANAVPMFNNTQTQRLFYAARFIEQAMPVKYRETPLVQSLDPEDSQGRSFEEQYGRRVGAKYFDDDAGEVTEVTPDNISVKLGDGSTKNISLYNNFQFNRKTQISNKPLVKPGDKLKKGQLVASSNFTDDNGTLAMGVNARVGLAAYKGFSMDDAIVISDSFARKITSEHSYEHDVNKDEGTRFGKSHFTAVFPKKFTQKQLDNLDEDGVVKPGTVLQEGDPIILATRPKQMYSNAEHLGKLGKTFRTIRSDAAEVWDHPYPGVVTDTVNGKKAHKVFINADAPAQVGDKIVFRHGSKAIISKILPDDQMLRSVDGKPFEVLLNPLALPSRVNVGTLYEMALGKVAAKTGKPIKMPAFTKPGESRLETVRKMLKDVGLSDTEEVFDPMSNRKLEKPISAGIAYVEKLHHVVASKKSARGQGSYDCYSSDTECLTRRGWVLWGDVTPDDELATVESDGSLVYEKPLKLVSYMVNGHLYRIHGDTIDLCTTDNHKHVIVDERPWATTENQLHQFLPLKKLDVPDLIGLFASRGCKMLQLVNADSGHQVFRPVKVDFQVDYIPYSGMVYCATMRTGMVYVRRNGKAIVSGNSNEQPQKGGSDTAQAKRLGGLEATALLAKGGYATLREGSTLRGQKNDDYFRLLRQGYKPAEPGKPFIFDKFLALLNGSGMHARDIGKGTLRLAPFTDRDLAEHNPMELENGKMIDPATLDPIKGGLFDERMVALNKWGKITLPHPMPNPAMEKQICQLLNISQKDLRRVLAGEVALNEVRKK